MQHKQLSVGEMPVGLETTFPATAGSLPVKEVLATPEGPTDPSPAGQPQVSALQPKTSTSVEAKVMG